jgi:hypothetical protein
MRLTLDTNILAYAEGVNGSSMKEVALDLVQKLPQDTAFLPVQVLGELLNLLVRKGGRTRARARAAILSWRDAFPLVEASPAVMSARRICNPSPIRYLGCCHSFGCCCGRMPAASVRRLAVGFYLEWGDSDKPIFPTKARASVRAAR